jgi:hypothetical protein
MLMNGQHLPVAQIGGGRIYFDRCVALPTGSGEIILHVDEHQSRWRVTWAPTDQPVQVIDADFRPVE